LQCNKTKTDKNPNTRHPIPLKKPYQWGLKGLPEMEILIRSLYFRKSFDRST
jgi:hypothetical protein